VTVQPVFGCVNGFLPACRALLQGEVLGWSQASHSIEPLSTLLLSVARTGLKWNQRSRTGGIMSLTIPQSRAAPPCNQEEGHATNRDQGCQGFFRANSSLPSVMRSGLFNLFPFVKPPLLLGAMA
jgi:hypothetical protein